MFFLNVDYSKDIQKAKIYLAKPNKTVISHIYEKFNANLSVKLGNIYELTFSIPHFINDEFDASSFDLEDNKDRKFDLIKNEHVEKIREKMLLKLTLGSMTEWFIVDSIEEDGSDENIFNVTAFSLGYELSHKRISSYLGEAISCKAMATEVLSSSSWKVGTIDAEVQWIDAVQSNGETKRTLELNDSNALDAILQIAEAFRAIVVWDTNNKTVSFKNINNIGSYRGMSVNYGRLLKSINRTRTTDELVTRMYAFGHEDLTIAGVNPTGQMYIEDFSFFMYPFRRDANKVVLESSYFMSDALCHALLNHQELVQTYSAQIYALMSTLLDKQLEYQTEMTTLQNLQSDLQSIDYRLDTAKAVEDAGLISSISAERASKQAEVTAQQSRLDALNTELQGYEDDIENLRSRIANEAGFTTALHEELNYYIIEREWRDDRYINADELYNDAIKRFAELREPKVVITVDIENLFEIIEEQYYWDKLALGELIKINYPQMNLEYMARIIEINYDFDGRSISITIANTEKTGDEYDRIKELLSKSQTASTILDNYKYKWDRIQGVEDEVYRLINSEWDANKRKIIAGVNNKVEIGNRGIIIRNPDMPNEVIIMQSGIIALSMDDGETWKTAIKPDGIIAERIIGNLIAGRNLIITNGSKTFTVDEDGVKIVGASLEITGGLPVEQLDQDYVNSVRIELTEAKEAVDALEQEVGYMLSDSMITELESKTLELSLKRALSESQDIITIANSLGITTERTQYSTALTTLQTELNKYIGKSSYPIEVTQANRTAIENAFSDVEGKKSVLSNKIMAIRESQANAYTDQMKASIDAEMVDVLDQLDDLSIYIGDSFKDGVIEEAEAKAIGTYINSLRAEKDDLDNKYAQVYTNTSLLSGTVKTNLHTAKGNYDTAHTNLINSIQSAISNGKTTTAEKQDVDTKFTAYRTNLGLLSTAFERALDAIGAEKARVAEENAKNASIGKGEVLNGVKIDATNGLVVTTSNSKNRVYLNATRGIAIQKNDGTVSSPSYSDVLSIDTNGNINIKSGVISWGNVNTPTASQVGALTANSSMLTNISATGIYTGTVTTNQLVAGSVKITSAMIENLVVGTNVSMGANAYISWGNITNRPTIPSSASDVGAISSTYIDSNGVWTGKINANTITSGTITGRTISGGTITGATITGGTISSNSTINVTTDATIGNNLYLGSLSSSATKMIRFSGSASVYSTNNSELNISAETLYVTGGNLVLGATSGYTTTMQGRVDFSSATIVWGNNKPTATFG